MTNPRHARLVMALALSAGAAFACRLVGNVECEDSIDCPTSSPVCEQGLCTDAPLVDAGPSPTDAGLDDAGAADAGHDDAGTDAGASDAGPQDAGPDAGPEDAGSDAGPGDAGVPVAVPIEPPGGRLDFNGVLGVGDVTMMNRPSEACNAPSEERGPYYFDAWAVVNQTGQTQDISVSIFWSGGDGYLLLYRGGFDPATPTLHCAGGDDDTGGTTLSAVPRFTLAPDELVVIVATTFSIQASIPEYLLEVATLGGDAGVPDDAGLADAGPPDAGGDAGVDAGAAADAGELEDGGSGDGGAPGDAGVDAGPDAGPVGPSLILTEVVDHPDDALARFVEIFNAGDQAADLSNVRLRRYSNGQSFPTGSLQLTGTLVPGGVLVAARDGSSFQSMYGRSADYVSGVIDGTGNDVYELVDGAVVLDIYGEVGVDGSGQLWDYTDRVAKRVAGVFLGKKVWEAAEWTISSNGATARPGQRD